MLELGVLQWQREQRAVDGAAAPAGHGRGGGGRGRRRAAPARGPRRRRAGRLP